MQAYRLRIALLSVVLALPFAPALFAQPEDPPAVGEEQATERWWQVEVILFRHLNENAQQEEEWPTERAPLPVSNLPWLNELLTPFPETGEAENTAENLAGNRAPGANSLSGNPDPGSNPPPGDSFILEAAGTDQLSDLVEESQWFEITPEEEWLLSEQVAQMRWTRKYDILLHQSWRHHLEADQEPLQYRLVAGPELTGIGPELETGGLLPLPYLEEARAARLASAASPVVASSATGTALNTPDGAIEAISLLGPMGSADLDLDAGSSPHYQVEGSMTFELFRYLHVKTDLWLSLETMPPMPAVDPNSGQAYSTATGATEPYYIYGHLKESRRLRSGEVHYLDHPLLGAIVSITPWEKPVEDELTDEALEADQVDY